MVSCAPYLTQPATVGQQKPTGRAPDSGLAPPRAGARPAPAPPGEGAAGGTGINHRKTTLSTTAASYRRSARPDWLRFLANTQTLQEQLLELITPGEVVSSLLNGFPARARDPLINQFPTLRQRWNKLEILDSGSPAAEWFIQLCYCAGELDGSRSVVRTIEKDFTWQQSLKPMTRTRLANTLCQHADALLSRLLTGSRLFDSSLETVASVCQFLAGHGVHPAVVHQLRSPSGRCRNIMVIPAQDGLFLITHFNPPTRHYVPDFDAMVLSHAGITCREFTTSHMRVFSSKLTAMLQLNTYPELMQTYHAEPLLKRLEYYDCEHASELLSRVTFLMSAHTQQMIDCAGACDLDLVKLILSSPSDISAEDSEDWGG